MSSRTIVLAAAALAAACQAGPAKPQSTGARPQAASVASAPTSPATTKQAATAPASVQRFGQPITAPAAVPLDEIAARPGQFADTLVRTEGTVTAVCQKAGCWMEIQDGQGQAHIRMHQHAFLVPKSASGRHAVVQATVLAKPGGMACGGSCGADGKGCGDGCGVQGDGQKVELDATGVELM